MSVFLTQQSNMQESRTQLYVLNIKDGFGPDEDYCRLHFPLRFERSKRFRFEEDRLRCLAVGYLLAEVLSLEEIALRTGPQGKPYVPGGPEFSLSHSGDYAVLAVSDRPVGVDIERVAPGHLEVARRVCTPQEQLWLAEDPENRFWTLWTLKEALSKAVGKGLSMDYRSFCVLPLIRGETVLQEGEVWYGSSQLQGEYALSVVSAQECPAFSFTRL